MIPTSEQAFWATVWLFGQNGVLGQSRPAPLNLITLLLAQRCSHSSLKPILISYWPGHVMASARPVKTSHTARKRVTGETIDQLARAGTRYEIPAILISALHSPADFTTSRTSTMLGHFIWILLFIVRTFGSKCLGNVHEQIVWYWRAINPAPPFFVVLFSLPSVEAALSDLQGTGEVHCSTFDLPHAIFTDRGSSGRPAVVMTTL
jgi:hypothetical protein